MMKKVLPSRRTVKWFAVVVLLLAIPFTAVFVIKKKQFEPESAFAFPPEVVTSYVAESMDWEQSVKAVGTLRATQGAVISAEVSGTIAKFHFESGEQVEKGDLLFELDTSAERAQLASAEATLGLAEANLKRAKELRASGSLSQSELDTFVARASEARAEVERITANLQKRVVRAPFSGRLGIRQADLGEYLNPGSAVVSLQALDPIYIDFSLPQQLLSKAREGDRLRLEIDTYPEKTFEAVAEAIDPDLNENNRMLRVRGALSNAEGLLKPGMFATVRVIQPESKQVVAVPGTSIYYQAYGNTVFVIKEADEGGNRVVEQRFVKLGETKGDYVAVISGVEPGDEVVSAGVFKLSNGRSVAVDNSKALEFSLNPQPSDA